MRIGIDLGGTKIEAIALDDAGSTLLRRRVPTPAGDYTRILNAVADLVATAEKKLSQQGTVGVAARLDFDKERPHQEFEQHYSEWQATRSRPFKPVGTADPS